jgi:hypothetical protein
MILDNQHQTNHYHLVKDRYGNSEYMIDDSTYGQIMDLIQLYHESTYQFPDYDRIKAFKINENGTLAEFQLSINSIIFI